MATEWQGQGGKLYESLRVRHQMLAELRDRLAEYGIDSAIVDEPTNLGLEVREGNRVIVAFAHADTHMYSFWRPPEYSDGEVQRYEPRPQTSLPNAIFWIRRWSRRDRDPGGPSAGFRPPNVPS